MLHNRKPDIIPFRVNEVTLTTNMWVLSWKVLPYWLVFIASLKGFASPDTSIYGFCSTGEMTPWGKLIHVRRPAATITLLFFWIPAT